MNHDEEEKVNDCWNALRDYGELVEDEPLDEAIRRICGLLAVKASVVKVGKCGLGTLEPIGAAVLGNYMRITFTCQVCRRQVSVSVAVGDHGDVCKLTCMRIKQLEPLRVGCEDCGKTFHGTANPQAFKWLEEHS